MNTQSGPPPARRTHRKKIASELRLLRRDGFIKYMRVLLALRRFHRSVHRAEDMARKVAGP